MHIFLKALFSNVQVKPIMNTAIQVDDGELSLIQTPIPKCKDPNDVVIKVRYCGICGTDLSIIAKNYPSAPKVVMGHEFAGTVTNIGTGVKHLCVGDRWKQYLSIHFVIY